MNMDNLFLNILQISTDIIACKPDQKFFLMRFSQLYPHGECRLVVKDLAAEMGVNDRVVSSSVKFWEGEGVLIKREAWEKIRVRERSVGYLSISWDKVTDLLENKKLVWGDTGFNQIPYFIAQIESLTLPASKLRKTAVVKEANKASLKSEVRGHDLNVSQRLLLIILLWMANPCGVVRGIGKKRLCQLTGARRERLDAQIEAFLHKGYLLAYLPGGSRRGIEGVYTATYYLNVNYEKFTCGSTVLVKNGREFDFPIPRGRDLMACVYGERFGDGHAIQSARQNLVSPVDDTLKSLISSKDGRYSSAIDNVMGGWFAIFWREVDKLLLREQQTGIDDVLHEVVREAGERSAAFQRDVSTEKNQVLEEVTNFICDYIWAVARGLQRFIKLKELGSGDECTDYIPAGCKVYEQKRARITLSPATALLIALPRHKTG